MDNNTANDFHRIAVSAKERALRAFESVATKYEHMINIGSIPVEQRPAIFKEIYELSDAVSKTEGALSEEGKKTFVALNAIWNSIQRLYEITQDDIDAAQLKFKTVTGRKTATPIFRNRFDL